MGKPAVQVRRGDERVGDDGCVHRVVHHSVDTTGAVTIAYDIVRASGGVSLQFDVVPPDDASTGDTGSQRIRGESEENSY